jgi:hypothetical protein
MLVLNESEVSKFLPADRQAKFKTLFWSSGAAMRGFRIYIFYFPFAPLRASVQHKHSNFGFVSDFDIRISDFCILYIPIVH